MNNEFMTLINKQTITQDDNQLLAAAFKHFKKVQIWSCLINFLMLIPNIVFFYFCGTKFNISQNDWLLPFFIFSVILTWLEFMFIPMIPFIIFSRRIFLSKHPLLADEYTTSKVLSCFFFGIPFIFFLKKAEKFIQNSTTPYSYENEDADYFSLERTFIDWILLLTLIGIGVSFGLIFYFINMSFVDMDVKRLILCMMLSTSALPFFYWMFVYILAIWGVDTVTNWKYNQAIYTIGMLGMYFSPIVIIILILKIHHRRKCESK